MPLDINKIVEEVIQEMEEATTMITTPTGDTSSATSDQKKKIKMSSDKGEDVKIVKKGEVVREEMTGEEVSTSQKVSATIDEAISTLSGLAESDDKKAKRYSEQVIGHLNKAKTALEALTGHETKLSEQAAAQDAKSGEKQIKAIEKALSKTVKNPDLVARIMKKVPVNKAIELKKKAGKDLDPDKVAEAILKVSLKEAYGVKMNNINEALNKDIKAFGQDLDKKFKDAGFDVLVVNKGTPEQLNIIKTNPKAVLFEVSQTSEIQTLSVHVNPKMISKAESIINKFQLSKYDGPVLKKGWTAKQVKGALNPGDIVKDEYAKNQGLWYFYRLSKIDTKVKTIASY